MPLFNAQTSAVLTTSNQSIAGVKTFIDTTASSNYANGAVVIAGGLGVAGNIETGNSIHSGGSIIAEYALTLPSSSNTHVISGTLSLTNTSVTHNVAGGLTVSKRLTTAGRKSAIATKSANYTTVATDEFILIDATGTPKTITLLAAATAGAGATITIIKIDASTSPVTITPVLSGGTLTTQYQTANFVSNGTSWYSY